MDNHLRFEDMGEHYREMTREDLIEASARKPVRRLLQADVQGLCEGGARIIAQTVLELRSSDAPMRLQIAEGAGQGEALFFLAELKRLIEEDWHLLGGEGYVLRPRPSFGRLAAELGSEDGA